VCRFVAERDHSFLYFPSGQTTKIREFFEEILCKKFSKKEIKCGLKKIEELEKILKSLTPQ